jgi:hypothetical protein
MECFTGSSEQRHLHTRLVFAGLASCAQNHPNVLVIDPDIIMDYLDPISVIDPSQLAFPPVTSVNTEIYLPMMLDSPLIANSQHWVVAVADLSRSRLLVFNSLACQPHIYHPGLIRLQARKVLYRLGVKENSLLNRCDYGDGGQQDNDRDCGPWVIRNAAEYMKSGRPFRGSLQSENLRLWTLKVFIGGLFAAALQDVPELLQMVTSDAKSSDSPDDARFEREAAAIIKLRDERRNSKRMQVIGNESLPSNKRTRLG